MECYTRNTLNNQIDTYMFTYFLSENGMSRLWKKVPTKQELFNGEKIIFSVDTGLLSSLGARSSMKVFAYLYLFLRFPFETNVDLFFFYL